MISGTHGEQTRRHQKDQDKGEIAQGLRNFQRRLLVLFGTTSRFYTQRGKVSQGVFFRETKKRLAPRLPRRHYPYGRVRIGQNMNLPEFRV